MNSQDNPTGWKVVDTFNTKVMHRVFSDAKNRSMMIGVSETAGSGKTTAAKIFNAQHGPHVYFVQCRQWQRKRFLVEICKVLNIGVRDLGHRTADDLMERIITYMNGRVSHRPLLIIDEADKLRPDAITEMIHLYNMTEDRLGIVLMGTEALEKMINNGIKYQKTGFDEVSSRLGRKFVKLFGITKKELNNVCRTNGVADTLTQNRIWKECEPRQVKVGDRFVDMITDLRRMKRLVVQAQINESEK